MFKNTSAVEQLFGSLNGRLRRKINKESKKVPKNKVTKKKIKLAFTSDQVNLIAKQIRLAIKENNLQIFAEFKKILISSVKKRLKKLEA